MAYIGVDIGHGVNTYPPSKGVRRGGKGYAEHDFNAKLGIAVKDLLEQNGHRVIFGQQPYKKDVPLRTRTNLYNREGVDLVVSLHANYNSNTSVNGRCVFYWGTSSKSKALAQQIVKQFKALGYSTHGNGLHAGKRGSWTNLHINRETNMPAVLVEHGFMSGDKDFELIFGSKQAQYIKDMAKANVAGIQAYLGLGFKGEATVKPKPNKPATKPAAGKKSIAAIAKEVAAGKWGNNPERAKKLKAAGYNPKAVQAEVNRQLGAKPAKKPAKSLNKVANEVIAGKWGNNPQRSKKLASAGYNADKVQAEVNKILSGKSAAPKKTAAQIADEIYRGVGNWGTGETRKRKLRSAGYNPSAVQSLVNKKFR